MKTVAGTKVIIESWYGVEERQYYARRAAFTNPENAYKHFKHLCHLRDLGKDWHISVIIENTITGEGFEILTVGC